MSTQVRSTLLIASAALAGVALPPVQSWAQDTGDGSDAMLDVSFDEDADASEAEEAESDALPMEVGVFLGGNFLSRENELGNSFFADQVPRSGFLLGFRASYLVWDKIAPKSSVRPALHAELEAKFLLSSTAGGSGRPSISTPVVGWRANALVDLYPQKKLIPFALVGIGGETVFGSNRFMTSPDTDAASYLGGGLRYLIRPDLIVRADLRGGLTAGRFDALSVLGEVHVGVSYRFASLFGNGDSTTQQQTKPVLDTGPVFVDSDGDGVADESDNCPDMAESKNGIDDQDGCPEMDTDGDGKLGSQDKCPAAAEDKDGFQDDDGCPDEDNDEDGVKDAADKCPSEKETANGYEDEDGCPDEVPQVVQAFTGRVEGIVFKSASARILRKSRKTLNKAFEVLRDNKSVRIEISGHTDDRGDASQNRALSRKRADYVKWYLVDKGIPAERIKTIGYGPDKPVGDNLTNAGRQANRRIEFRLLSSGESTESPAQ